VKSDDYRCIYQKSPYVMCYVLISTFDEESPFSEADVPSASQENSVKTEHNEQGNTGCDGQRHIQGLMLTESS
jgi:hypothetical protein